MKKKRFLALIMALTLCLSLFIMPDIAFAKKKDFTGSKVAFKVGSTTYKIGGTSKTWKNKLGRYKRTRNESYVAGLDSYTYNFSSKGIKVETTLRVRSNKETIVSAIITGKSIKTSSGLKVGSSVDTMIKLYGSGYRKSNSTTYTYTAGGKMMAVKVDKNDKVKSITMLVL